MPMLTAYDNYYKYFRYKNNTYTEKTGVKIAQSYIDTHLYDEKKIWKYAMFSHRVVHNNEIFCFFTMYKTDPWCESRNCCGYFLVPEKDIEMAIEEIIKPVPINIIPKVKSKDCEVGEVVVGWVIYIVVLIFSFILKQWYLVLFWGSIYFFIWRNRKLRE